MGSKIVAKFKEDGKTFRIYDANKAAIDKLVDNKQVIVSDFNKRILIAIFFSSSIAFKIYALWMHFV